MWIDDHRLKALREPDTDRDAVDRLFAEVLAERVPAREVPEVCPLCQQGLVVRTLGAHAIRMCPSEHGAWLGADDVARLRAHDAHEATARQRRQLAFVLLALAAAALYAVRPQVEALLLAALF